MAKKKTKLKSKPIANSSRRKGRKIDQFGAWPKDRQVLFRPERLRYVRKMIPTTGCVFCAARDGGVNAESLQLYASAHSMIVLNKFPYNPGHLMVLPKRHCGDLLELSELEYADLQATLKFAFGLIKAAYSAPGANIGLNHGAVAGAGIPEHLHWHLIPRWAGDTNFFPLVAETKVVVESLAETYARLKGHLPGR